MNDIEKQKLEERNNRIIQIILEQIKSKCPDSVDLIGIGGSFCTGDIYENSDLDLVILVNSKDARVLNKCFILGNVGFDIYTQDWSKFENMALYNNPYVTKLFLLDIVYVKDESVRERYLELQDEVKKNMQDSSLVLEKVAIHFEEVLKCYQIIKDTEDKSIGYKMLAKVIRELEYIIYMLNASYVKRGTKRIPEEIASMNVLPHDFLDVYLDITNFHSLDEIRDKVFKLIESVRTLLEEKGVMCDLTECSEEDRKSEKMSITPDALTGTYEEIYSNYKNKMYHAVNTNNRYLSFITMASCQEFYDAISEAYDIPEIHLIEKYNPDNLEENAINFDKALEEWKGLYDAFHKEIVYFESLEELSSLYK